MSESNSNSQEIPDTRSVNDHRQLNPTKQSRKLLVQPPATPPGVRLLDAIWRTPDLCHQLGTLNRQNNKFRNLPVDGVADAVAQAQKLSSDGEEAYFACAEYLTPDSRAAANAFAAHAFWVDVDCGEDKTAAGKGYATVEDAEKALIEFCTDTGLPNPTHIVHSGGGLHGYWALGELVTRDMWQSYARKLKDLMKACGFLADPSRTADITSVLRVPNTLNYKYAPPRLVSLEYSSDELIELQDMLDVIDRAHNWQCGAVATRPSGRPTAVATSTAMSAGNTDATRYGPPDLEKLSSALAWLDPDCEEETWKLRRLAPLAEAARNNPNYGAELYELARSWSSGELRGVVSTAWITPGGNGLTGEAVFDDVWQRFLKDGYSGIPVTLGTVYYDAKQAGWNPDDQFQIIDVAVEGDA